MDKTIEEILKQYDSEWENPQGVTVMAKPLRDWILDSLLRVQKETRAADIAAVKNLLDNWTTFTCHSKKEHEDPNNDCSGWSHEDQHTRETVLSQVRHQIEIALATPPETG